MALSIVKLPLDAEGHIDYSILSPFNVRGFARIWINETGKKTRYYVIATKQPIEFTGKKIINIDDDAQVIKWLKNHLKERGLDLTDYDGGGRFHTAIWVPQAFADRYK